MNVVNVALKRSHYGATADEVRKAFNVDRGQSTLLGMAVDPEHRATVQEYRDIVAWKLAHTEGESLAKWRTVARHLDIVLGATEKAYAYKVGTAAISQAARP